MATLSEADCACHRLWKTSAGTCERPLNNHRIRGAQARTRKLSTLRQPPFSSDSPQPSTPQPPGINRLFGISKVSTCSTTTTDLIYLHVLRSKKTGPFYSIRRQPKFLLRHLPAPEQSSQPYGNRHSKKAPREVAVTLPRRRRQKSTMPVLANVLLSAEGNTVTVSATDLYLTISGSIEAEVKRSGSVALPARDVHERVKAMPDGPIKLTVTNGSATTLQAVGSARRYTLHGLPGSDFPQLPEPSSDAPTIEISVAMLQKLVKRTIFSISSDETRPHLNSALLSAVQPKAQRQDSFAW